MKGQEHLGHGVGHAPVERQHRGVDEGEAEADGREVLVEGEGHRPLGDRVEDARRQQQAVDDRARDDQVRQQPEQARRVPRQAVLLRGQPGARGVERAATGRGEDARDGGAEQQPGSDACPPVEAPVPHASHVRSVRGRATTSPVVEQQQRALDPGTVEQVQAGVGARDDRRLGEHLGLARAGRDDGRLDDVGDGRPAGARVEQVVAGRAAGAGPPSGGRSCPRWRCRCAARRRGPSSRSSARSPPVRGAGRRPRCPRPRAPPGADRDVAVGVDERRGVAAQQGQRPVGDPALGHAVEVEPERLPAHHLATPRPPHEVPARRARPRRGSRAGPGRPPARPACRLRREPLVEQGHVEQAGREVGRPLRPVEHAPRASAGPPRTGAPPVGVERREVGGRR